MSGMISKIVTSAAGITVYPPIDNNFTTGGGDVAVGACVIMANKGPVGKITTVTAENWQEVFGRPMHMSVGTKAEGLRHLNDALDKLQFCHVVRVAAADARFPSIAIPAEAGNAVKSAHAYGTSLSIAAAHWLMVYPVDGDPSLTRRVVIRDIDTTMQRFTLAFEELVSAQWLPIPNETFVVGIGIEDKDDTNLSAYLPNVLEERGSRFRAELGDIAFADIVAIEETFTGGVNGGDPTVAEWQAAFDLLKTDDIDFNLCFAAGNYDPVVLGHMIEIADGRMAQFRFDVPPWLTETAARQWLLDANLESYQASCFHYPYKATDEWYSGKSLWGVSGSATASKALCLSTPTSHASVKGAHLTAAGTTRGRINRRGVEPLHNTGFLQPTELVKARINPVKKGLFIADCLNIWYKENYLRFEHTTAILNDLIHDFLTAMAIVQFEPDSTALDVLQRIANDECQKRVDAQAFVAPRNPALDGDNPFSIKLKQVEIDFLHIEVAYAQTGVARRIALQPRLMA